MSLARKIGALFGAADSLIDPALGGVPTGVVLPYALKTAPDGWLMCYGQALASSDTSVARLRARLLADDSPYGVDGSGNPKVPDVRGRADVGCDSMGGTAAGRLTTAGSGVDGVTIGAAGGAQNVTLTAAQSGAPAHGHAASSTHTLSAASSGAHTHSTNGLNHSIYQFSIPSGEGMYIGGAALESSSAGAHTHTISGSISTTVTNSQAENAAQSHSNIQPIIVLNKIIKL